jgi:hypothetical protein
MKTQHIYNNVDLLCFHYKCVYFEGSVETGWNQSGSNREIKYAEKPDRAIYPDPG